ncbi:MAG: hypothetical protein ACT6QS_05545 [Flavobacteriales bacterium]
MSRPYTQVLSGGILYIPSVRSLSAQWGAILFVLGLGITCFFVIWWLGFIILLFFLFYLFGWMPAIEIHPDRQQYRRSNNLHIYYGGWKPLPKGSYLNIFAVGFTHGYENRPKRRERRSAGGYTGDYLNDRSNMDIYLYLVSSNHQRFVLAHYSGKKTALREARIVARFLGLDLWNATLPEPAWDEDPAKQPRQ